MENIMSIEVAITESRMTTPFILILIAFPPKHEERSRHQSVAGGCVVLNGTYSRCFTCMATHIDSAFSATNEQHLFASPASSSSAVQGEPWPHARELDPD